MSTSRFTTAILALLFPLATAVAVGAQTLPAPWHAADVGDVGIPGTVARSDDGRYVVSGAGSDIWGTADSFFFVYQTDFHEGFVVSSQNMPEATNPFAKAGLMIRSTLDPGSPHVILDVKPDGSVEFMTRAVEGG